MFDQFDPFLNDPEPLPPRPNLWAPAVDGPAPGTVARDDAPRRPRRRGWKRWLIRLLAVALVFAAGVAGFAYWQARSLVGEFQTGAKKQVVEQVAPELNVAPSKPAPGIGKAMTILAIGADKRYGSSGTGNSDTMMLVRVDPDEQRVSILSIPRDLYVPIPGHGMNKINAAYAFGGEKLLTRTIREYFGVPINHFVSVSFGGFQSVVGAVGGVYLPVDGRYLHVNDGSLAGNWAEINLKPGYQKLDSADALSFVRFRHLDSDFYRAARQQLFMRELGRQIRATTKKPTRVMSLLHAVAKATTSDLKGVKATYNLAGTLRAVPSDRITRVTVEANGMMMNGISYLQATGAQKAAALKQWSHPGSSAKPAPSKPKSTRPRAATAHKPKPKLAALIPDGGRGRALIAPLRGLSRCAPSGLPAGYAWPAADAARRYELAGHPAAAAYATAGSGRSVLWMFTSWQTPPILDDPTYATTVNGRRLEVWKESGRVRQVAWRIGGTRAWVTNTLRNELTGPQMLALAAGCQRV